MRVSPSEKILIFERLQVEQGRRDAQLAPYEHCDHCRAEEHERDRRQRIVSDLIQTAHECSKPHKAENKAGDIDLPLHPSVDIVQGEIADDTQNECAGCRHQEQQLQSPIR